MLIRRRRGYELPESQVTPEALVLNRRALFGAGAALLPAAASAQSAAGPVPPLPEHQRNMRFRAERDITAEREATTYNNFYEFGSSKSIARDAARMPLRPWTVKVDGMVANPREFAIDDLIRMMPIEERVLRLRCVEAWSMVVPWTGFPLAELMKAVQPQAGAKYLAFQTASIPAVMPGLRQTWYPWPHVEACTVEEANNELAFLAIGNYGKPLQGSNGAPIRVLFPWKYGFKSGKSIVRITLTDRRPNTFWGTIQPSEYGFWANVNPEVAHPRWSQASERVLGTGERVRTQLFNGYGEFVSGLYTNLQNERLWT
ncbi:protein-methionine-sulfoxide reductase catalytic subunit MsrP [Roseococcus sp. YIM B11640]|uniref:protein-methionine-sulfoxide reductase catalytic subunit MsrP n=1 Tax=Roseococcus sp. YIM B11640 TaxID=3133973 RepID=UPI003C7B9EC2